MAIKVGVSTVSAALRKLLAEITAYINRVVSDGGTVVSESSLRSQVKRSIIALSPSLYTVPNGRKAGVLYSILPESGVGDFSVTRAGTTAYELDENGTWVQAAANVPRFDRSSGTPQLIVEGAATNLLLNSETLATQDVTVTERDYTIAFEGSGSVTLSGAATGTLSGGSGRVSLTFDATAGTLTVTVSGEVKFAQIEAGSHATTWIKTTSAAETRNADVINLASVSSLIGQTEGWVLFESDGSDIEVFGLVAEGASKGLFNYDATDVELYADGELADAATGTYDWSSMDNVVLGKYADDYLNGKLKILAHGKTKLTAVIAASLT